MLRHILPIIFAACFTLTSPAAEAVPALPREMRAAWMATVYNIDWPSKAGLSKQEQQAEMIAQLDFAAKLGLNTIFFQVRSCCDAIYASKLDPWSVFLTGTSGVSPGYDPLTFTINAAHERGLELHAWFNPFRAKTSSKPVAANHVTMTHPEWIMNYGKNVWLDPGMPETRAYTLNVVSDLLARYDLDGIHIDDYFYPYPNRNPDKSAIPFTDDETVKRYAQGKDPVVWRRENINSFVEGFYKLVKQQKPQVKVGISPFGIWQPGTPTGIQGILNAYTELAADAKLWMNKGWADYFSPQLYWRIDPPEQSFPVLQDWWASQNTANRPLCPGIASSRIDGTGTEDPGRPATEIIRQIELARKVQGHAHWSLKSLVTNRGGIADLLKKGPYADTLAMPPACPWVSKTAATVPSPLAAKVTQTPTAKSFAVTANPAARWLTVQAKSPTGEWKLAKILPATQTRLNVTSTDPVALRWISPTGVEGPASVY